MTAVAATLVTPAAHPPAARTVGLALQLLQSLGRRPSADDSRTAADRSARQSGRHLLLKNPLRDLLQKPERSRGGCALQAVTDQPADHGSEASGLGAGWRRQLEAGDERPCRSCGSWPLPVFKGPTAPMRVIGPASAQTRPGPSKPGRGATAVNVAPLRSGGQPINPAFPPPPPPPPPPPRVLLMHGLCGSRRPIALDGRKGCQQRGFGPVLLMEHPAVMNRCGS